MSTRLVSVIVQDARVYADGRCNRTTGRCGLDQESSSLDWSEMAHTALVDDMARQTEIDTQHTPAKAGI